METGGIILPTTCRLDKKKAKGKSRRTLKFLSTTVKLWYYI
jgi:hypothetical protein